MNLWLRLVWVTLAALFRRRLGPFEESVLHFRVLPTDLDVNIHMNNARYLAVMDLGRFDLLLRTGMWRAIMRARLRPLLASSVVRYRRPLAPFQRFRLRSRLIGWDDRRVYMEHVIESRGAVACHALMRAAFLAPGGGTVAAGTLARAMGFAEAMPPLPEWAARWRELDVVMQEPEDRSGVATERVEQA